MNMKKITLEYNSYCLCETSFGFSQNKDMAPVKGAKPYEVITVENSVTYKPGQCLTKKQVKTLCDGSIYDVKIGLCGQYKKKKK